MRQPIKKNIQMLIATAVLGLIPLTLLINRYYDNRLAIRMEQETISIFDSINTQLEVFRDTIRSVESLVVIRQTATTNTNDRNAMQLALDTLRSFIGAASLFVLDNQGIMLDGSGMVTVGANYKFRKYFQKAMEGQTYIYPAIGVNHKTLRMFFSAPLSFQENGEPAGVVAFSIGMEKIESMLKSQFPGNIYGLITENGVVFATSKERLLYKATLPITQAELESIEDAKQFVGFNVELAGFLVTDNTVMIDGKTYAIYRKRFENSNIELFSLIAEDKTQYLTFIVIVGAAYALIVFLVIELIFINDRKIRAEKEIIQRNIELETFNRSLRQEIDNRLAAEATLAEANRKLESISITDALSGLANRRHFDDVLASEYARHVRSGEELSLIMLDIDHFKAFNDHYGHLKGDECLRRIAGALAQNTHRASDLMARYGGEEFACILPGTDKSGALQFAERLRQAIIGLGIPHNKSPISDTVTVSLGIVATRCTQDGTGEDLVARADRLLYRAKEEGRNQVVHTE